MNEHRELREALGAYVLGGLDPSERHAVEDHLQVCAECREEVADLAALPPLLGRLRPDEAAADLTGTPVDVLDRVLAAVAAERRRQNVAMWAWRAATAAAVLALVFVWRPWTASPADDAIQAEARPVVAAASATSGVVDAYAWEWGTTVQLDVTQLPDRGGYVLWAVSDDGMRQQAGAWGPTAAGGAKVRGASAIQRDDLERVEVTDESGEVLLIFPFG